MKIERNPPILAKDQPPKSWSIWIEGYAATGEHGGAQFICSAPGRTFMEAVLNARGLGMLTGFGELTIHNGKPALWGCRLFDNEQAARRTFG